MTEDQKKWIIAKGRMIDAMKVLGFPEALGNELVKNLGSPKAMDRMTSYLNNVKPKKAELVVDYDAGKLVNPAPAPKKDDVAKFFLFVLKYVVLICT